MRSFGGTGSGRRPWWFVLLGVLIVADVALVVAAVASTRPQMSTEAGPIPTFSPRPVATPSAVPTADPTASPEPQPSPSPANAVRSPQPLVSAVSATEAWRATEGSCSGDPAVVERTTDGGASWQPVRTTFDLRTVVALSAGSERSSIYGGTGAECTPQYWSSFTAGQFWKEYPDEAAGVAYVDVEASTVSLVSGVVPAPCAAPDRVFSQAANSVVSCADSLESKAGTADWVSLPVAGLRDLAPSATGYLAAVTEVEGCAGVAVQSLPAPLTARSVLTTVGCLAEADSSAAVALAAAADTVWVFAGDESFVSTDGGVTW
jgi:hypothetical protein